MKNFTVAILLSLLVVFLAKPVMAEYTSMKQYSGVVIGSSTTDHNAPGAPGGQMPNFWLPPSAELFPKINQRVVIITTLDEAYGESAFSAITAMGRSRGVVVLKNAKIKDGDLVFRISPNFKTGHGWTNNSDSNSGSDSWNQGNRSASSYASNSGSYGSRDTKIALRVRSTVVQIVDGEEAGAFSPEEFGPTAVIKSAQTSGSSQTSHSDSYSSSRRGQGYSTSSSSSSSTDWGSDEGFEENNMKEVARDERGPELATKFFWGYLRWLQETGRVNPSNNAPRVQVIVPSNGGVPAQTVR